MGPVVGVVGHTGGALLVTPSVVYGGGFLVGTKYLAKAWSGGDEGRNCAPQDTQRMGTPARPTRCRDGDCCDWRGATNQLRTWLMLTLTLIWVGVTIDFLWWLARRRRE